MAATLVIHPEDRQRSRLPRLRTGLMAFGYLVLALVVAASAYQWLAHTWDLHHNPPPGRLVDVGGYRMHINCIGHGTPTVILDSGLSDSSLSWYKVQPQVARFATVCSYDRAGLGWSDSSPKPRNSGVFAEELHSLLINANVSSPFILVGHSMGGLDVRIYSGRYRSELAGVVLVDSTHPDLADRLPVLKTGLADWERQLKHEEYLMPFGIPRLLGWCGSGPPEIRAEMRTVECTVSRLRETVAECESIWNESATAARKVTTLGDLPLVVLSEDPAKNVPEYLSVFEAAQQELARLSSNSTRVVAYGSGHQIQKERPDLVVAAVQRVVDESRRHELSSRSQSSKPGDSVN
jgi:pimeloyl-ACP methyl ester carboxylesterase